MVVSFFGVRHHSPTAARLVAELIEATRPGAVLVEGATHFNDRLELLLDHRLPKDFTAVLVEMFREVRERRAGKEGRGAAEPPDADGGGGLDRRGGGAVIGLVRRWHPTRRGVGFRRARRSRMNPPTFPAYAATWSVRSRPAKGSGRTCRLTGTSWSEG